MTVRGLLDWATRLLGEAGLPTPRLDAEVLLAWGMERTRTWLLTWSDQAVPDAQVQHFHATVQRRLRREPVAYITGRRSFFGLALEVTPDVLIPRAETELLVERALDYANTRSGESLHFVDIGTGSGAIAIALAVCNAKCRITATDLSPAALEVARRNARAHHVAERIEFRQGDLFEALPPDERAHVILSNPPYVSEEEFVDLEPNVRDHEPRLALVAPGDGLELLRRIIAGARSHLRGEGALGLEMGWRQGDAVQAMMREHGYDPVERIRDLAGLERVAWGNLSSYVSSSSAGSSEGRR